MHKAQNQVPMAGRLVMCVAIILALCGSEPGKVAAADHNWAGMPQVEIGMFSVGGRATYWNQNEGSDRWFGGAQVRLHPLHYLAVEGSVDYRRDEYNGGTKTHSFPVQGSLLLYPLGTTRVAPFIMGGGGWYYTTVDGLGNFSDKQHRFGAHAGGGVQVFLTNHISLDATYRYIWLENLNSRDANFENKKFDGNTHMVTVGANFHF